MENYLGEIRLFPYTQIPRGWVPCNGQTLGIAQNQALFALLGVYYGGNGTTNFLLPNLNGRTIVGTGQSTSSTTYNIGQAGGAETVTLTTSNLAAHSHPLRANVSYDQGSPNTNFFGNANTPTSPTQPAQNTGTVNLYAPAGTGLVNMAPCITSTGNNLPHENRMPYLALIYCIATQGIFPSRN
ncbi:phage tail protein [Chitinophaga rhizophila]|uniref:Tail fiber protein n=1 Tax=Chitinophaga rhizophila TaxID=2866212 RepID=A0ABS7GI88_9BACT|nr:tail fiber protein [Chitinophaga rhizophila]MBW8687415.1 tail fiber protein [Chitinophaga rhizophila]